MRANKLASPSLLPLAFLVSAPLSLALSIPSPLQAGWSYSGCYTDVGRTINAASVSNSSMTNEICIAYCDGKGYAWAGTEYSRECYCGRALATAAAQAAEGDCSSACAGNSTQRCGGGSRLTLFNNPSNKGPQPNTGIANWPHIGCYVETAARVLPFVPKVNASQMSGQQCTAACQAAGYILAGTEYGNQCYCGNTIGSGGVPAASASECNMVCAGNATEVCGGPARLNVYDFQMKYATALSSTSTSTSTSTGTSSSSGISTSTTAAPSPSTTSSSTVKSTSSTSTSTSTSTSSTASATPTGPSQPATVGNYNWYGCQTEATNARALAAFTYAADTMTLDTCQAFCAGKGTTYFGTEYGRECYCGNSFSAGSAPAPASDCSQLCAANKLQFCGNGNRLSVYVQNGNTGSSTSSTSSISSTSSTSSASSTTTSVAPSPTAAFPTGWTSQGCWVEGTNGRIIPTFNAPDDKQLTQESCAQLCFSKGYNISGTEYFTQCYCSNAIYNGGALAADQTKCNTPCGGNKTEMCGGAGYVSVVSNGPPPTYLPPTTQLSGLNDTWAYQGCYTDNVNNQRTLPWALHFPGTMTPSQCLAQCGLFRYAAAGLEYGQECYCGDPADVFASASTLRPDSECNIVCAGNASAYCGGGSRLSTYFWTGSSPQFTFNYPQGQQAGSYSNLVGGVVTPLMTMQSITGKVTFLEKWGTGPANSTGAFELDLSQVGNFSKAWRTMHVKTDIFCSAGLTLPDKAGRQLTIGGWSLDSTFGVRLYWPDGSPGVPGKNDWQENDNEIRLQTGRWYPSAMVMTNGSILVVGGEVGSNAAAAPSIEILPYTGTPPVYMDWLARTDPNNLYPFLNVLPSRGIFVSYWNEARILDEVTLETIKTLPNMPTAVNDPQGGRTYPFEGTSVLLPQYAPYTDPLGVLICGGSTAGHEALDNCASIYPDAPNPTWTLERMPSKRVMSCVAPLPDGTYLIANGAKEGVAGFGLAKDPNLNAVLYDPSKPVHARMSVMANTSVARLYHSEAITLLDGRVLITGSDPQDGVNPQEIRVEVFTPPYLYSALPRPSFNLSDTDWAYGDAVAFTLGSAPRNGGRGLQVSLLGSVSSTHGNSMGARTLFAAVSCAGTSCTVTAPPSKYIAPPGWYQMFVVDGGIPAVGVYVRIGGDPGQLGNWPPYSDFTKPGV